MTEGRRPRASMTRVGGLTAVASSLASGFAGSVAYASFPAALPILLLGGGLLVGFLTDRTGLLAWGGAAVGIAAAGVTHPGLVNGPDANPAFLLVSGVIIAALLFVPGWLFGTAVRTRRHGSTAPFLRSGFVWLGIALLMVPVAVLVLYVVALAQGGGCCP